MNERANIPALVAGGSVGAIIPNSVEQVWRVAAMIVEGDLAPFSLVGRAPGGDAGEDAWKRWGKKATSAVATVIMSGAELGLPPMVAMRSFTVIGGRPALYGDGLINVVRRSRKAEYVRTGYDAEKKIGWCEAKRSDTGEEKRVEFSEEDARRAGLWDEREFVRRKVYGEWKDVPNDAPWARYPQRMLAWRAAGYCLRELFADVLGGITDEFEAREINGNYIDHEPETATAQITPPSPDAPTSTEISPPSPPSPDSDDAAGSDTFDYGDFFERFQEAMKKATDEADVEEVWSEFDPEGVFAHEDDGSSLDLAHKIKTDRLAGFHPVNAG